MRALATGSQVTAFSYCVDATHRVASWWRMAVHPRRVLDVLTAHRDDDILLTLRSTLHPFGMRRAHGLHSWMAATSSRADAAFVSQLGLGTVGVSYALCGRRGNTLVSDPATLITLEYGQS